MSFRVEYHGQAPDNIGEKEIWVFNFSITEEISVICHYRFNNYDYGPKTVYDVGRWKLKQVELKK